MTPQVSQQTFLPLRVVIHRLASTSTQRLPHVVPSLAATLAETRDCFLAAQSDTEAHYPSEAPVLVHRLKTQLSALLQDRSAEARYAAIVLIKTTVEVGGWSVLHGANSWIKGLISILGRPNPEITKQLCVLALTRIFILTNGHPSLIRELATPAISGFIIACLNIVKPSTTEVKKVKPQTNILTVVFQSFNELIPTHPTVFRPFVAQIKDLAIRCIAPIPSDIADPENSTPQTLASAARRLFVSLSICAPKNTFPEAWAKSCHDTLECTHRTNNIVFRALVEDLAPSKRYQDCNDEPALEDIVHESRRGLLNLSTWTGINAGVERLDGLLKTLGAFVSTTSPVAIALPVGEIVHVIERILSALPHIKDRPIRTRPEINRDERESLLASLPYLHVSAIHLCSLLLSRLGRDAAAISVPLMEQILWTLDQVSSNDGVRKAAYEAIAQILNLFGPSLPRSCAAGLSSCLKTCCEDLLTTTTPSQIDKPPAVAGKQNSAKSSTPTNTDHYHRALIPSIRISPTQDKIKDAAVTLISLALTNLPKGFISSSLRQQVDRTAILTKNMKVMFASAMRPPTGKPKASAISSIMPFLTKAFPGHLEAESLIRPRMPPLQSNIEEGFESDDDKDLDVEDPKQSFAMSAKRLAVEIGDSDANDDVPAQGNGVIYAGQPPTVKRQKVAHEETTQDLAEISSDTILTNPATVPIGEITRSDGPIRNSFDEAIPSYDSSRQEGYPSPSREQKAESSAPVYQTQAGPEGVETLVSRAEMTVENDDDDDSDGEMPVLEMDSDDDEDQDDEGEDEGNHE